MGKHRPSTLFDKVELDASLAHAIDDALLYFLLVVAGIVLDLDDAVVPKPTPQLGVHNHRIARTPQFVRLPARAANPELVGRVTRTHPLITVTALVEWILEGRVG